MRAKKWLTIITCVCSFLSLIIALIIGKSSNAIAYDIALAVFGSALLGFIMSLTEYFTERRNAMERFWDLARRALNQLRKIEYIEYSIHERMSEEEQNSWIDSKGKEAEKCLDSMIAAGEMDLGDLGNAYGNMEFLFRNGSLRMNAYNKIYKEIMDVRNLLAEQLYHFKLHKNGEGNFFVCIDKASKICETIYEKRVNDNPGIKSYSIYQTRFDDIADALEDFRCSIYWGKTEREENKRTPVLSKIISIEDVDEE